MDAITVSGVITSAVAGVLLTLILGAIGYLISAKNENRKWRRQQRLEIYLEVTKLHKELRKNSNGILASSAMVFEYARDGKHTQEELDEAKSAANHFSQSSYSLLDQIDTQTAICKILGTSKMVVEMNKFGDAASALFKQEVELADSDASHVTLERLQTERKKYWDRFLYQAQRDLGLKHWWNRRP